MARWSCDTCGHSRRLRGAAGRRTLASLDEGERAVRAFRPVSAGHVRVAATSLLGGFDLVSTIGGFRLRYPGVTVSLRTGLIAELLEDLRRGRADVVIGPVGEQWEQAGYRRTEIADERLVLITPLSTARCACPRTADCGVC